MRPAAGCTLAGDKVAQSNGNALGHPCFGWSSPALLAGAWQAVRSRQGKATVNVRPSASYTTSHSETELTQTPSALVRSIRAVAAMLLLPLPSLGASRRQQHRPAQPPLGGPFFDCRIHQFAWRSAIGRRFRRGSGASNSGNTYNVHQLQARSADVTPLTA